MTFEEIMVTAFTNYFNQGYITLADNNDGQGVFIEAWNVPNVTKPTHQEVMAMETPQLQQQFLVNTTFNDYLPRFVVFIDSVAQKRQYTSTISCISYINSTNEVWRNEAQAFSDWRDSAYAYALNVVSEVTQGIEPIPTYEDFINGVPPMVWP